MKTDLSLTFYFLARIRALSATHQARWRDRSNRTLLRREAKRIVFSQWLAEAPGWTP